MALPDAGRGPASHLDPIANTATSGIAPDTLRSRANDRTAQWGDMGIEEIDQMLDTASVRQVRTLLADTPDAMVALLDTEGTILWASRPEPRDGGHEPSSLIGTNSDDYVHPDDRDALRRAYARAASGETVHCTYRARTPDGGWGMSTTVAWAEPGASGPVVVTISSGARSSARG